MSTRETESDGNLWMLCCGNTINKPFNCVADTLHGVRSKVKRYLRCCGLAGWGIYVNYTHDWESSYDLAWKGGLGKEGFEHFVINASFNYPAGVLLPNWDTSSLTRQWEILRHACTWEAFGFKVKIQKDKCTKKKKKKKKLGGLVKCRLTAAPPCSGFSRGEHIKCFCRLCAGY